MKIDSNFINNINKLFPKLDFMPQGMTNLNNVVKLLTERNQDNVPWDDIEGEFLNRLNYLNTYGTEAWRVQLSGDWGNPYNFGLTWYFNGEPMMNGLLQFNGNPGSFASVLLGEFQWWSIHT